MPAITSLPTLFEQAQQHARERPNHIAVWNRLPSGQYEATSYSELAKAACRFAQAFTDHCNETRFVPLCLARSASCIAAMLGAIGAGKAFVCLHQKMRLPQVSDILEATRASLVLVDDAGLMTLRGRLTEAPAITRVQWWLLRGPEFGALHEKITACLGEVAVVKQWQADGAEPNGPAPLGLPTDPCVSAAACSPPAQRGSRREYSSARVTRPTGPGQRRSRISSVSKTSC